MFKEFKEFAIKGNVLDLAVGIIIGGAFGKIVSSFVTDIIMPPIGFAIGGIDFKDLSFILKEAVGDAPAIAINYGLFINTIIDFVIIAFSIFIVIKQTNRFMPKKGEASPSTKECQYCYSSISLRATRCPNCTSNL